VSQIFLAQIPFREAVERLEADPNWDLGEAPDLANGCRARFLRREDDDPKRGEPQAVLTLFWEDSPDYYVLVESCDTPMLFLALELSLQRRIIEVSAEPQDTRWYEMAGWSEGAYDEHRAKVAKWLGLSPDLPPITGITVGQLLDSLDEWVASGETSREAPILVASCYAQGGDHEALLRHLECGAGSGPAYVKFIVGDRLDEEPLPKRGARRLDEVAQAQAEVAAEFKALGFRLDEAAESEQE
jgi:hypothetical protein